MCKKFLYFLILGVLFCVTTGTLNAEQIWREAENALSITAPFQVVNDSTASGGQYIVNPAEGGPSNTNPPTTGIATYSINIKEGGTYRMYLRVLCTVGGNDDDSCYVRIQGATPSLTVGTDGWINSNNIDRNMAAADTEVWFWAQVQQYDGQTYPGGLITLDMTPGTYTVEIAYREDGLKIDGFLITNEEVDTATLPDEIPLMDVPIATRPNPANGAEEIPINTVLSWVPGIYANTHNVFLGTDFNDVNNATTGDSLSTTLFEGYDVNNIDPGTLKRSKTYYWRVDEINEPSAPAEYKGMVWSFNTELIAYPLETSHVTATANDAVYTDEDAQDPNSTCNGAGLDANDMHSTKQQDMWLAMGDPGDAYIQYAFDRPYKLYDMKVWNYNEADPSNAFGAKDVNIVYSLDGQTWMQVGDTVTLDMAPGDNTCQAGAPIDLQDVVAKYVKIIFWSGWDPESGAYGISEVRFSTIPTYAQSPAPANDATDQAADSVLSWKAGRDANDHYLYMSTDPNDLGNSEIIHGDATFTPVLTLGQKYYWRVDEVNNAEDYPVWEGLVWNFTTASSIMIDGFETGYGDTNDTAVWNTWLDGFFNQTVNGAEIGKGLVPPGLSTINHSGGHSAPVTFDNTGAASYSEITAQSVDLPIGTPDWSIGSPKTLTIWFYGDPNTVVVDDQLYCKIGGKTATYGDSISTLTRGKWYQWDIDLTTLGVNLSNIQQITIGIKKVGATGGKGILYLDDIQLTGIAAQTLPVIYIEAENADSITSGMSVQTEASGYFGTGYIASDPGITQQQNMSDNGELQGVATYTFEIPETGQYRIGFRDNVYTDANSTNFNSFWVKVSGPDVVPDANLADNFEWANFNEIAAGGWVWADVWDNASLNNPITYTISEAGTYTIQVAYREAGNRLDAIEIRKTGDLPQ